MSRVIHKLSNIIKHLLLSCCYWQCSIESMKAWMGVMMLDKIDGKWMGVSNYKGDCSKNMQWVKSYTNCIQYIYINWSYLPVTNNVWLNLQNNEWEWWSMNASASKIWNELNHRDITFKKAITLLLTTMIDLDKWNNEWVW